MRDRLLLMLVDLIRYNEDTGFEAVVTADALYLNLLRKALYANNKEYEEERHVAEPFGLFRINHSAFLATDTFQYNGKAIPSITSL